MKLFKLFKEENNEQKKEFNNILDFATKVIERSKDITGITNNHPITDVVRLLGRGVQTHYLMNLLYVEDESNLKQLRPIEVYFKRKWQMEYDFHKYLGDKKYITIGPFNNVFFDDLKEELTIDRTIELKKDLVLPWPWKRERLISSISYIGESRPRGEWLEDEYNHKIELWLPLGIAWVHGGNHSIASGIIQGVGVVKPKVIYDISKIYDYIYCDGMNYIRIKDNTILGPVTCLEFAAIFEIGRMMKENDISF